MFKQMERNRGFGVTLEQVHEWTEDCETVIGAAMKSFMRKERRRFGGGEYRERSALVAE